MDQDDASLACMKRTERLGLGFPSLWKGRGELIVDYSPFTTRVVSLGLGETF